jgi:outer membrane protein OmpA-like peptidoglycan-associated protein
MTATKEPWMTPSAQAKALALALLALGGISCVYGAKLREDAKLIEKKIANARERGAYRCAPKELAKAEANLEFLQYELDQGDFRRAARHHTAALENINRALEITDPNECAEKRVLIMTATDRDGDGILDENDRCPDEPEDVDTFEDQDGCPDPDNDADTVLDPADKCPLVPGDPAAQGCPLADRDGDGIADDVDQCPDIPEDLDGNEDKDGCPEDENKDQDGDGILDKDDKCPLEPEDKDQFQDEDGCPDPDNDQDTVLDIVDACPLDPGLPVNNGCPVKDRDGDGITDDVDQCPDVPGPAPTGCPKRVLVVKTGNAIEIKQQIQFETGKATIKGRISFEILDQVSAVLKSNPIIKVVIEGHTDSVGAADYNLKLSDGRAHSVRDALIERGVDPSRLEAIGYGESKPIASNRSKKGRQTNRRSEFKIVQQDAPAPEAPPTPATP